MSAKCGTKACGSCKTLPKKSWVSTRKDRKIHAVVRFSGSNYSHISVCGHLFTDDAKNGNPNDITCKLCKRKISKKFNLCVGLGGRQQLMKEVMAKIAAALGVGV